uniref:Uncharacterized protein n=2 Tax=Oryza TaxID=4527 RepID=A0A0D3F712_9ORYZ
MEYSGDGVGCCSAMVYGGNGVGCCSLLHYTENPMRTEGGCALGLVSLPHRILFWGEGGGHLCLPQLLLTELRGQPLPRRGFAARRAIHIAPSTSLHPLVVLVLSASSSLPNIFVLHCSCTYSELEWHHILPIPSSASASHMASQRRLLLRHQVNSVAHC